MGKWAWIFSGLITPLVGLVLGYQGGQLVNHTHTSTAGQGGAISNLNVTGFVHSTTSGIFGGVTVGTQGITGLSLAVEISSDVVFTGGGGLTFADGTRQTAQGLVTTASPTLSGSWSFQNGANDLLAGSTFTQTQPVALATAALTAYMGCREMIPFRSVDGAAITSGTLVGLTVAGSGANAYFVGTTTTTGGANVFPAVLESDCAVNGNPCWACIKGLRRVRCITGLTVTNTMITSTTRGLANESSTYADYGNGRFMEVTNNGMCTVWMGGGL